MLKLKKEKIEEIIKNHFGERRVRVFWIESSDFEEVFPFSQSIEEQQEEMISNLTKNNAMLLDVIKQLKIEAHKNKCNDVCEYVNNLLHKLHKSRAGNKRLNDENIKLRNQQVKTKNEYRVTYPDKLIITPDLIMKEVFDYFNTYMPGSVENLTLSALPATMFIKRTIMVRFVASVVAEKNGFYVWKFNAFFADIFPYPGCTSADIIRKIEELLEEK